MARSSCLVLLLGVRAASATTATDTFTATLPTATETFTLPTTAATSTETYTLPTATFTLPTGGETATHTFTLPTSTATYDNKTFAPTKAPTAPTGSPSVTPSGSPSHAPSGTDAPSHAPSKQGDTWSPTSRPSVQGDTSAPVSPTSSPSKQGETNAPRTPTSSPSHVGDTNAPTQATHAPTTAAPTDSPSHQGDTISPTTAAPTSTTDPAVLDTAVQDLLVGQNLSVGFGGPGCNTPATTQVVKIVSATQTQVAGGVTYQFVLDQVLSTNTTSDTQAPGVSCASGGFVYAFRNIMASAINLVPSSRMPTDNIGFGSTASRRNQELASSASAFICNAVSSGGSCVTMYPTSSPTVSPSRQRGGGDDDFPGWAIALCVVLPVLAIGAAVAIYFFVCNKGGDEQGDEGNAPDTDAPKTEQV